MLLVWHRLLVSVGLLVVNWRIFRFFFSGKDIQLQSSECPSQGLCPGGSTAFEVPQRFSIFSKPIYQHPVISSNQNVISYWKIPPRNADGSSWVPVGPPAMATVCSSARSTPEEASARMKHWSQPKPSKNGQETLATRTNHNHNKHNILISIIVYI